jgi:hypothetical protein
MALKRKEDHDGGHPPAKRARLLRVEDAEESAGSLGNSTSSALSNLPLNDKRDHKDDDVLVLYTDKDLL